MNATLSDVAMLATSSSRCRIYLDMLERNGMLPEVAVYLEDPSVETPEQRRRECQSAESAAAETDDLVLPEDPNLDVRRPVLERLDAAGIPVNRLETLDPNASTVVEAVGELDQDLLVFCGPGGVILEPDLLEAGPRFLHVHAGTLPEYRGSTTVYYMLLNEGRCGATAFVMTENIDDGPIVAQETYPPPEDPETLDLYYDPWIRARLLVSVLSHYQEVGGLPESPQKSVAGETYFIIHPVLKHLALASIDE